MEIFSILQTPLFQLISELQVSHIDILISVRKEENIKESPCEGRTRLGEGRTRRGETKKERNRRLLGGKCKTRRERQSEALLIFHLIYLGKQSKMLHAKKSKAK